MIFSTIFSEIYGTYYNTMAKILKQALSEKLTADGLYKTIVQNAYNESIVPITDAINKEKWQLLKFNRQENRYSSIVKNNPAMPLTTLQKRYLKTILRDKRIRLFEVDFDFFEKQLSDVAPLWNEDDFKVFDKYADGDDFENPKYIKNFRMIVEAHQKQLPLTFTIKSRRGKDFDVIGIPQKIEYSEKDDKFRVMLDEHSRAHTINLGKIVSLNFVQNVQNVQQSQKMQNVKYENAAIFDADTIVLELTDERNALERVLMHFSNLKKRTSKIGENKYRIELEFSREDETEMVIRLLQFGPVIKVLEPEYIVGEIVRRLSMQLRLMS